MILEFELYEQDFLEFQLFAASQSKQISKNKLRSWLLVTLMFAALAVVFYFKSGNSMAIYFGIATIAAALLYPKYLAWYYKRHFTTYVKENYSYRFGEEVHIEIDNQTIFCKDKAGEGTINTSEIEKVDETDNHFFVKIKSGVSLIIPKQSAHISDEIRATFERLGVEVNNN